jgi:hypothetical protein
MKRGTVIEIIEPLRHLRLVEDRDRVLGPVDLPLEPHRLIQDFYLETVEAKTVLRLVHSGFGDSTNWDLEYEGTRDGWPGCFLRLQHGLERHRNETVHNYCLQAVCPGISAAQTIAALEAAVDEPWQIALRSPLQLTGILTKRNGSILSMSTQHAPDGSTAYVELLLFAIPDDDAVRIRDRWSNLLAKGLAVNV